MSQIISDVYLSKPLDREDLFRLLELQPGHGGMPLTVRLLTSSVGVSEYEAVSYVWGDATKTVKIRVITDNGGKVVKMPITVNCHAALYAIRKKDRTRILWIDSICINQNRVSERNHQLTLMSRIYREASQVLVYLGDSGDNSDIVMDWFVELDQPSDEECPPAENKMIEALFQRAWFHRIWVLQEITLARQAIVICGDRQVSWDVLRSFGHCNRNCHWIKKLPRSLQYTLSDHFLWGVYTDYALRLFDMLRDTRECQATDGRDKLYALLPLLNWQHEQMLSVLDESDRDSDSDSHASYETHEASEAREALSRTSIIRADYDCSVQKVFTELAVFLLQSFGLDTIRLGDQRRLENLPSWVTDWTAPSTPHLFQELFRSPEDFRYRYPSILPPGSPRPWSISVNSLGNQSGTYLQVSVASVGVIEVLGDTCDICCDIFPIEQWTSIGPDPKWWHDKGLDSMSPFMMTLAAGSPYVHGQSVGKVIEYLEDYNRDDEDPGKCRPHRSLQKENEKRHLRDIFRIFGPRIDLAWKEIFKACDGRRFFITNTGHLGLAPDTAVLGDSIFILRGCSVPFILRNLPPLQPDGCIGTDTTANMGAQNSAKVWTRMSLVGETWTYGIMESGRDYKAIDTAVADKIFKERAEEVHLQ